MSSQITSVSIACLIIYAGADLRKHQSSVPLAFVRGIHRWPVNSPQQKASNADFFPFDDIIRPLLLLSGSLPWPSVGTLKLVFNVSSDSQGNHEKNLPNVYLSLTQCLTLPPKNMCDWVLHAQIEYHILEDEKWYLYRQKTIALFIIAFFCDSMLIFCVITKITFYFRRWNHNETLILDIRIIFSLSNCLWCHQCTKLIN